jgi:hypothetical protein
VNNSFIRGARGLPGGTTLAELLVRRRGYRNVANLPPLTVGQIRRWAARHFRQRGSWPLRKSGLIAGTTETWYGVDDALRRGYRGYRRIVAFACTRNEAVRMRKARRRSC